MDIVKLKNALKELGYYLSDTQMNSINLMVKGAVIDYNNDKAATSTKKDLEVLELEGLDNTNNVDEYVFETEDIPF